MKELSQHILDLARNSISAGAGSVDIAIDADRTADRLRVLITDDGRGMPEETLKRACDPFFTTKPSRRIGLGIPLARQTCEDCGGSFSIWSREGEGTRAEMIMRLSHEDLPPLGDLSTAMVALVSGCPDGCAISLSYRNCGKTFLFDTAQIRAMLGEVPVNIPDVLLWLGEFVSEGIEAAGYLP